MGWVLLEVLIRWNYLSGPRAFVVRLEGLLYGGAGERNF
jgi:hypothetical protein